jgi:hypothetical protein
MASIETKPDQPTEQHYLELFGWARTHVKRFRLRYPDCEDAVQYVVEQMPQIWKYFDPARSTWNGFCYLCSKRKVMDWMRVNYHLTRTNHKYEKLVRIVSVNEFMPDYFGLDFEENKIFTDQQHQPDPKKIVAIREFLEQLYKTLTPLEQKQFHRMELFPYTMDKRCLKYQTKSEDNCKERIKAKAEKLLSDDERRILKRDRKSRLKRDKKWRREGRQKFRLSIFGETVPIRRNPRKEQ